MKSVAARHTPLALCTILSACAVPLQAADAAMPIPELPGLLAIREGTYRTLLPRFRTSRETPDSPFGTHVTSVFSEHVGSPEVLIGDVSRAGFRWIKDYIAAGTLPAAQSADDFLKRWEAPDPECVAFLKLAEAAGLRPILRLSDFAADGGPPVTPASRRIYARFCALQVRHYKTWVRHWELGNEPNIGNEKPHYKPADYALLCNEAIAAIKAEDPQAHVWVGATAMLQCLGPRPYPWIPEALAAGLRGDGFSIHPYCQPYRGDNYPERGSQFHPWTDWPGYDAQIAELRAALDQSQLSKAADGHVPIATTEAGWPTHVDPKTWRQEISWLTQAKYEQRAMLLDFRHGIQPHIGFVFTRPFQNAYECESQFQLVEPYASNIMNWSNPGNRDALFRPAYLAAAAVCAVLDNTCTASPSPARITGGADLNPQLLTLVRPHGQQGFVETLVILWAGVPAQDRFQATDVTVTITEAPGRLLTQAIGFSLLPVGATVSTMPDFDWNVREHVFRIGLHGVEIPQVPLADAPYVIRYAVRRP